MTTTTSTIDDIIRNNNPFAGHTVVRPPQIWGKSFPDVPSINAHASNAVFDAVQQVRKRQRQTVGITIIGEKGLGKSQIISRIRHNLQAEGNALFVYMSKYDNLNQLNYEFLQSVVSSLRAFGNPTGVMQWQELATILINDAKKWNHTPEQYINVFPSWLNKYSEKVVEHLADSILQIKPDINNPYLVRAILWTLSPGHSIYATHWLSGLDLTEKQADTMGLPNPKKEDREANALTNARQILDITSDYKVPVICFDEVDELNVNENGWTTAMVVASLAKHLSNNLKHSVLLLTMYAETWRDQIKALPQVEAVIDRIANYPKEREPIDLKYLNSDEIVTVTSQWLKEFYQQHQQNPPTDFYPFDENQLRKLGERKPTVRAVLKWCSENFGVSNRKIHPVEPEFKSELANVETNIDSLLEDSATIAKALKLGFFTLENQTLEGVTVEKIEEIKASSAEQGYIHFKVVGKESGNPVKIGVAILQESGGRYQGAALKRLIDYQKFDITRGCLVRSKKLNSTAGTARDCVKKLLKELRGEWVKLQVEHIKELLALWFLYEKPQKYELTQDLIVDFIKKKQLAISNPLIKEILSDPSGQEPGDLIDEDMPVSIPKSVPDSNNGMDLNIPKQK